MTDTAILARFGKKEDFQEFQLNKRIVKRTVAEIFGCSMNEPIWVFYEKKICAELILEESCFTPEKKGVYFVARAQDLKKYPYSVETYLGGLRRLQRGQEDNAIDSDFERMSKQIRPNTAILAHYGYEHQRFFELPLNESVPKTAVAEICDGQRTLEGTEPFWIFYQQDLCTSLKSENDSFTPTENNIYLVARAKDLRDYPRSVEAYKSGVRVLEPPLESLDKPSS